MRGVSAERERRSDWMEGSGGAQRDVSVSKGVERRKTKKWATLTFCVRARSATSCGSDCLVAPRAEIRTSVSWSESCRFPKTHGDRLPSRKVRVCRSQDERSFSACRTAVRRYLRPARAGSAAAITPSAHVMLHVLSASTQLGARPTSSMHNAACTIPVIECTQEPFECSVYSSHSN